MHLQKIAFIVFVVISGSCLSSLRAQQLIDLGDLDGGTTISVALGINDSGQIAGFSEATSGGDNDAFLYSNGVMANLGDIGSQGSVSGINDSGEIVGTLYSSALVQHAFLYSNGTINDLGTLGGNISSALGINDSGEVVGFSYLSNGNKVAMIYSGGAMQNLGLGNSSNAYAINSSGQITGHYTPSSTQDAFLYSSGSTTNLGALSPAGAYGTAVNDAGQVAGVTEVSDADLDLHAMLDTNGTMKDLGSLGPVGYGSLAYGINNAGQVVGDSATNNSLGDEAFLYSSGTGMKSLDSLYSSFLVSQSGTKAGFYNLEFAYDINNNGQIVGMGEYTDGNKNTFDEAFLLNTSSVPEPSSYALLVFGLGLLAIWHFRTTSVHGTS